MIPAELPEADTAPEVRAVSRVSDDERMRRWRIVLGAVPDPDDLDRGGVGGNRPDSDIAGGSSDAPDGSGRQPGSAAGSATSVELEGNDARIDAALAAIYDSRPARRGGASRAGGLGRSAPSVVRWLGDIRRYFPTPVVQVLQRDAVERLGLRRLLLEPELLRAVEPDLHLVTLLVELNRLLPDETRATARAVVDAMVREIVGRLGSRTMQAVNGALSRAQRGRRPRPADIDWPHTIRANLHHYLPEQRTVIPQRLVGYGRRRHGLARDVIVAIDQSGSMADSVVYAAVFGAVLAQIPTLQTSIVAFGQSWPNTRWICCSGCSWAEAPTSPMRWSIAVG